MICDNNAPAGTPRYVQRVTPLTKQSEAEATAQGAEVRRQQFRRGCVCAEWLAVRCALWATSGRRRWRRNNGNDVCGRLPVRPRLSETHPGSCEGCRRTRGQEVYHVPTRVKGVDFEVLGASANGGS
jgi:hypothetical protein